MALPLPKVKMTAQNRSRPQTVASYSPFATVEKRVEHSTEIWARDLTSLFGHAKERFGDVSWETECGGNRIWGHKAVIYARAPKAFKDRYFLTRPFSRSPSARSPSPSSSHLLPPLFSSRPNSPPTSFRATSSLSARTSYSDVTLRAPSASAVGADGVMRLTHGDTPELFQAQLEWLYTGEGFGDVVEWISEDDAVVTGSSIRDSLGRRGNQDERRDKLGQDLTYMWRSKLYVDVRIHLDTASAEGSAGEDSDSDESTDSLSSTAVFTAHRFILVSRSPYFAALLLNTSSFLSPSFSNGTVDIHLPTPPFTPASLHFCLGYIYAGHLDFSNRTFDLTTAFQIYRAASYLQLDSLIDEVTARIVWDFCHGIDYTRCHCKRCAVRVARVWRFAMEDDVGNTALVQASRAYLIAGWGGSWSREVGLASKDQQADLVQAVKADISPRNIMSTFRSIGQLRTRMEDAIRSKGSAAAGWVESLEHMVDEIEERARGVLVMDFGQVAEGKEMWELLDGKGFSADLIEGVMKELVDCIGGVKMCVEAPRVYQALVSSILLETHPETMQTVLPIRSRGRQIIEGAKDGVVAHMRRRWLHIRDAGGFVGLESWVMKEIADAIEVNDEDLVAISTSPTPRRTTPQATRSGIPRTVSKIVSLGETSIGRSSIASSSRTALSPTREAPSMSTAGPVEPNGLRRLRLSSSASTSSALSSRSLRPRESSPLTAPTAMVGPQARSPTAARTGNRVSIGGGGKRVVSAASEIERRDGSPTPSSRSPNGVGVKRDVLSGGIRPLVSRGSLAGGSGQIGTGIGLGKGKGKAIEDDLVDESTTAIAGPSTRPSSPKPTPSVSSVRTTRTTKSTVAGRTPGGPASKTTPPTGIGTKSANTPTVPPKATTPSASVSAVRTRTSSVTSTRTPRMSVTKATAPPVPSLPSARSSDTLSRTAARTPLPKASALRPISGASVASTARSRLESAASVASSRLRTTSASTTASTARSRNPSTASTLRNIPPVPTIPIVPLRARNTPATPNANARSSGLSPQKSRLGPKAAPRAPFPTGVSSSGRGLQVPPNRSSSSSTAEDPEARTPRSSETGDPIIRLPSDIDHDQEHDGQFSPAELSSSPVSAPRKLPPPIAIPRTTRKISSSSVRSTASARLGHPASAFDPPRRPLTPPTLDELEIQDGSETFKGQGVSLRVGIPCIVSLEGRRARFRAQVKYIGYLSNAKGPWVGIEAEDLDRFGVNTLPAGSQDGVHYFHLTQTDPVQTTYEARAEAEFDARTVRQRKIETIRDGLGKGGGGLAGKSVGLGLGLGFGLPPNSTGIGERGQSRRGGKRSISPFVPGAQGGAGGSDWVGSQGLRALFVRPSEVVYVVGAE